MATTHRITCAGCAKKFTAKSPRAKWCSTTCRQRNARAKRIAARVKDQDHPLVVKIRAELTEADKLDDVDGILALELAQDIAKSGPGGKGGLIRLFTAHRAAALNLSPTPVPTPAAGDDDDALPDPGDAVIASIEQRIAEKRGA